MAFIRAIEVSTLFFFNESSYSSYCRIKSSAAVISPSSRCQIFAGFLLGFSRICMIELRKITTG